MAFVGSIITEPARALTDGTKFPKFVPSKSRPFASFFSNPWFIVFLDVITRKNASNFCISTRNAWIRRSNTCSRITQPSLSHLYSPNAFYFDRYKIGVYSKVCKNVVCPINLVKLSGVLRRFRGTPSVSYGRKISAVCKWVCPQQILLTPRLSSDSEAYLIDIDINIRRCVSFVYLWGINMALLDGWIAWLSISPGLQGSFPPEVSLLEFVSAPDHAFYLRISRAIHVIDEHDASGAIDVPKSTVRVLISIWANIWDKFRTRAAGIM